MLVKGIIAPLVVAMIAATLVAATDASGPGAGVAGYKAAASRRSARAEQRPDISSAGYFGQPNPFSPAEGFNDQAGDSTEHGRVAPPASASI